MKKLILSIVAIATIALSSFGQAPEGFKYQAVVRDAGNTILNNQAVGMRLTVQQGSIGGTAVYTETFSPTSNAYGLVNIEIGSGNTTDDFSTIDWSAGPYFIETAMDVTGGTTYVVMGTSQLMSVPYALYAKTSGNGQGPLGPQGIQGPAGAAGPAGADGQGGVTQAGTNVTITGAGTGLDPYVVNATDNVDDADSDPTNELQDWSNLPNIPAGFADNIDNVDDADNDPMNEIELPAGGLEGQVLTINGGTPQWVTPSAPASNIQDSLDLGITPCQLTPMGFPVDSLYGKTWAGGLIFYFDAFTCKGLVSAPTDHSTLPYFGCYSAQTGACTSNIIPDYNFCPNPCTEPGTASQVCTGLINGYDDWFLPTISQLDLMYRHLRLRGFGGFADSYYWSSTEIDLGNAWAQFFTNGNQYVSSKASGKRVRAVRAF